MANKMSIIPALTVCAGRVNSPARVLRKAKKFVATADLSVVEVIYDFCYERVLFEMNGCKRSSKTSHKYDGLASAAKVINEGDLDHVETLFFECQWRFDDELASGNERITLVEPQKERRAAV